MDRLHAGPAFAGLTRALDGTVFQRDRQGSVEALALADTGAGGRREFH